MNILIDSSVFLSQLNHRDSNHDFAKRELETYSEEDFWLTEHVFDEVINILQKQNNARGIKRFLKAVNTKSINMFYPYTDDVAVQLRKRTIRLLVDQKQSKASFTDLYSIVVAKEKYIPNCKILSFDRHFQKFGDILLSPTLASPNL